MRKIFQQSKYKLYSHKKSEKVMQRRVIRNKKRDTADKLKPQQKHEQEILKKENRQRKNNLRVNIIKKREKNLEAPAFFSIMDEDEPYPTFDFFENLWQFLDEGIPVMVDLSKVTEMTPEVILYLLSIMEIFSYRGAISVRGNCPQHNQCKEVFEQSGFFQYVRSHFEQKKWNKDILTVKHGTKVIGETADEVKKFAQGHLPLLPQRCLKASYRILEECMGNTKEHAYGNIDFPGNWWLMAYAREKDVIFCVLDNGRGIPKTMRRMIIERLLPKRESDLIGSAMEGAYKGKYVRASSGSRTRGKGLPAIYRPFARGDIDNLTVISGKGFLSFGKGKKRDFKKPFSGTLVSWTLPKDFMGR